LGGAAIRVYTFFGSAQAGSLASRGSRPRCEDLDEAFDRSTSLREAGAPLGPVTLQGPGQAAGRLVARRVRWSATPAIWAVTANPTSATVMSIITRARLTTS
jgi:hypothetical protein